MYGDTDVMRRHAAQLREQGTDIRAMADQLVAQTEAVDWSGRAADAMRERIRERATHLRDVRRPARHRRRPLERHLTEVDELKDSIAESRAHGPRWSPTPAPASPGRRHDDPDRRHAEPDDDDRAARRFEPPPPGHKDWLAVDPAGTRERPVATIDLGHPAPARRPARRPAAPGRADPARAAARRRARRRRTAALRRSAEPDQRRRALEDRLGQTRGHRRGRRRTPRRSAALHDPADVAVPPRPAGRRQRVDEGLLGAVGLLATPDRRPRPRRRRRRASRSRPGTGSAAARSRPWRPTTAWSSSWPGSRRGALGRRAGPGRRLPEDLPLRDSAVPDRGRPPVRAGRRRRRGGPHRPRRPAPGAGRPAPRRGARRRRRARSPTPRSSRCSPRWPPRPAAGCARWSPTCPAARPRGRASWPGCCWPTAGARCARTTTEDAHRVEVGRVTRRTSPPSSPRCCAEVTAHERRAVHAHRGRRPTRTSTTSCSSWPTSSTAPATSCASAPGSAPRCSRDDAVADSADAVPDVATPAPRRTIRAATTGKHGLLARSIELDADALVVRATVLTYRWIDELQDAAYRTLGAIAGRAIGYLAPEVALGGAIVSAGLIETDALDRDGVAAYLNELAEQQPRADGPRRHRWRRPARRPPDALAAHRRASSASPAGAAATRGGLRALGARPFAPTSAPRCATSPAGFVRPPEPAGRRSAGSAELGAPRARGPDDHARARGRAASCTHVAAAATSPTCPAPRPAATRRLRLVGGDLTPYAAEVVPRIEPAVDDEPGRARDARRAAPRAA